MSQMGSARRPPSPLCDCAWVIRHGQRLPAGSTTSVALQHASQSARLLEPFRGLEGTATSAEQRQMLNDLQEVAQALFNDSASFRDPGFGAKRDGKKDNRCPRLPWIPMT